MLNFSDENDETLEDIKETEAQVIDKLLLGVIDQEVLVESNDERNWPTAIEFGYTTSRNLHTA